MEKVGEVTAVHGEYLEITFCRPADCGHCHACHGARDQMQITLKGEAQEGDLAVVDMASSTVMKASVIAYILPLCTLLLGVVAGSLLFPQQEAVAGVVGGLIGLAAALLFIAVTEKSRRGKEEWNPTLLRILPKAEQTPPQTLES